MADTQNNNPEVDADAIRAEFEAAMGHAPKSGADAGNSIGHVIGIVSGKGGVGKSLVTGILASQLARAGKRVGIMDADITGPSIPRMFGLAGQHVTSSDGVHINPAKSMTGIPIVSTNLILENESDPVIWRGPMLASTLQQFWGDTLWGELDYLLVDMPPGTGDVALTVFQSLPVDGLVIVSSPQDLVQMVVGKAVKMANMMDVKVLGLVENMSYAVCPCCGERMEIFGTSHVSETAAEYNLEVLGRIPINPELAAACDDGSFEAKLDEDLLAEAVASIVGAVEGK